MTRVWPQPLIAVADVVASSAFYCELLGAASGHGGDEYEQIVLDGEFLLQLHKLDVEDHHGLIGDPGARELALLTSPGLRGYTGRGDDSNGHAAFDVADTRISISLDHLLSGAGPA